MSEYGAAGKGNYMSTNLAEIEARAWCFEHDVNILQVADYDNNECVLVVLEYSMMDVGNNANRKLWGKMAISVRPDCIMQEAKEEVTKVRSYYYASKQQ